MSCQSGFGSYKAHESNYASISSNPSHCMSVFPMFPALSGDSPSFRVANWRSGLFISFHCVPFWREHSSSADLSGGRVPRCLRARVQSLGSSRSTVSQQRLFDCEWLSTLNLLNYRYIYICNMYINMYIYISTLPNKFTGTSLSKLLFLEEALRSLRLNNLLDSNPRYESMIFRC